jgi:hypothetical protein
MHSMLMRRADALAGCTEGSEDHPVRAPLSLELREVSD